MFCFRLHVELLVLRQIMLVRSACESPSLLKSHHKHWLTIAYLKFSNLFFFSCLSSMYKIKDLSLFNHTLVLFALLERIYAYVRVVIWILNFFGWLVLCWCIWLIYKLIGVYYEACTTFYKFYAVSIWIHQQCTRLFTVLSKSVSIISYKKHACSSKAKMDMIHTTEFV